MSEKFPEFQKEYSRQNVFPFERLTTNMHIQCIWECSVPGCNTTWVADLSDRLKGLKRCPHERAHHILQRKNMNYDHHGSQKPS